MALYTELDLKQINEIIAVFEIGSVTEFHALEGGFQNSNYRIDTDDKTFVLTICEDKSRKTVNELANLLAHLEANGFTTSRAVATGDGNYLSSYKDKPVLLKEFLHGEIIEDLTEKTLFEIGVSLAALHAVPVPQNMQNRFPYGTETLTTPEACAGHSFANWVTAIKAYIGENIRGDLRKGLVHGDIFFNNVVITENAGPVIMDFEEAGHYYLIFDLGMAVVGLCSEGENLNQSKVNALIRGYKSIVPLNQAEAAQIKPFAIYAASVTACWRFKQFRFEQPDESQQDRYLEMKHLADNIRLIPNENFYS